MDECPPKMAHESLNLMGLTNFNAMDKNLSSKPKLSQVGNLNKHILHSEKLSLEKLSLERLNLPTHRMMVAKDVIMPERATEVSKMDKAKYYKLFKWYSHMGQPNHEIMKKKIATKQDDANDLTPQDIDEMPWVNNGHWVDVVAMNKLIYGSSKGVMMKL